MRSGSPRGEARRERRATLFAAKFNGLLWSIGNGLLGATLVLYVAGEIKSSHLGVSSAMILAAPKLVGLLRLWAPALIRRFAYRRTLAIAAYLASAACLAPLPWCAVRVDALAPELVLATIVASWSLYHLCEYVGTVALQSCCADTLPPRVRGRFGGRRERWLLVGNLSAMGLAAVFNESVGPHFSLSRGESLAATSVAGMIFFVLAAAPLAWLGEPPRRANRPRIGEPPRSDAREKTEEKSGSTVWRDGNFVRWVACGVGMSACNGLTQSAQFFCTKDVLGITFAMRQQLDATLRLGQLAVARIVGELIDRRGAMPTLIVCQTLVAAGMLFLAAAALIADQGGKPPGWLAWIPLLSPGWLAPTPAWLPTLALNPTWLTWIAFAGHNVALPTATTNLAPEGKTAAALASYLAWSDVGYATATLLGGYLLDRFRGTTFEPWDGTRVSFLTAMLLAGWVLRMGVALGLSRVAEPKRDDAWVARPTTRASGEVVA